MFTVDIQSLIKSDFLILEEDLTLNKAISKVGAQAIFIVRKGKYVGVPDFKKVLRSRLDVTVTKLKGNVRKTSTVTEHDSILDVAEVMAKNNAEYLPVVINNGITGAVFAKDILSQALELDETKNWKVGDIKLVKNTKLRAKDPVAVAIDVMHEQNLDHLPLLEKGEVTGVVSYKDLLKKYLALPPRREHSDRTRRPMSTRGAEPNVPHLTNLPLSNFATMQNLVSIYTKDSVLNAVQLMQKNNISSLIVMDGDTYLGLLTMQTLLQNVSSLVVRANFDVNFVGLTALKVTPVEKKLIQKVAYHQAFRLQRSIKQHFSLTLILKQSSANGREHLYHASAKLEAAGIFLNASREDWSLMDVLYTIFQAIETELQKKRKTSL